ncbi:MAG: AMP-binding protein [Prevotella sp.]|nr:AMP-binding protein [Prevotella sp.]
MQEIPSFNSYIEQSIIKNWDLDALTDYKGVTLQFKDVARKIEKLHIIFEHSGVVKGDKIAICGRNSAHWAVTFLATLTYGAVAVPILHEFNAEQIHNIVNHSEARLLFVGDVVATMIKPDEMPDLEGIVYLPDFSLFVSHSPKLDYTREHLNELYGQKYPKFFRPEHVHYYKDGAEELALINYTSGTTGFSKGVMLPYRALWGNLDICFDKLDEFAKRGENLLSILPMAHMYGMSMEFIFAFCNGCHLFFLTRLPSPAIIAQAFQDIKPRLIISVPLVIEKIIRKRVFPKIQSNAVRLMLNMPVVSKKVKQTILKQVIDAFGGNLQTVIVGGAALNQEVEQFLVSIGFPIACGYGTTECAPLISYSDYRDFIPTAVGVPVARMEVKILSNDPQHQLGEIVTRGTNLMLGYYKNPEATENAIDADGWYHTGDLGLQGPSGHIFIKGRIKNMLLGANGQNIYPEEIEDKLNSMTLVSECVVVQREQKLVALVYPDVEESDNLGFTADDLDTIMKENLKQVNLQLPAYCKLNSIEIVDKEFEKTPKKSIKRYLYK